MKKLIRRPASNTKAPFHPATERHYTEGLLEGRFGNLGDIRCPYFAEGAREQWFAGHWRGRALRHFAERTMPKDAELAEEVRQICKETGEKI